MSATATSCTLHLANEDGPRSLRQLLADQCPFVPPHLSVSSAHFFVSSEHDGIGFLTSSAPDPSFQLFLGPGQDKRFPVAEQAEVPLDSFVLVTPGVANFYTYIEYFPPRGVQPFSMAFHITAAAEANTLADLIVEQGHEPPGHPVSKLRFSVDSTNGRIILFRTPGSDDPDERMAVGAAQGFQFGIEAGQERTFHIPKLDTGLRMTEVFVQTESVANFVAYAEFHEHVMAERELSETVLRNARPTVAAWLSDFVERHGGFMGSVHLTEPAAEGEMVLVAAHNLSVGIQNGAAIAEVGKGMAGVTAERREPLAFPDLKADRSDIPHPEDRSSGSRGSVIVPVLSSDGSSLVAVVGLGFPEPRDFGEAEIATYTSDAERVRELV